MTLSPSVLSTCEYFLHSHLPFRKLSSVMLGFLLFLQIITSIQTADNPTTKACENEKDNKNQDGDNFSTLKLKVTELYGSRWALDRKKAISVSHAIDIVDATLIHGDTLTLRIEFNLRQSWATPELEFPAGLFKDTDPPGTFVSSDAKVLAHMWSPDSYISTARESKMNIVEAPLTLVYIFKNRTIIFKARMYTKVACTSSFQWYPLDKQTCNLTIESYKHHANIALYHWTNESMYRPLVIQMPRLLQYELQKPIIIDNGTVERGGRGMRYAFVQVSFTFCRKIGNNIIQVYTPTTLVVILSWFSFWLGLDAIPGRISLLVTCMLTLVTMHSGIKRTIPPVHYVTMMDVWLVSCNAMVFAAMCEFVVVKYLHWRQQQKLKVKEKNVQQRNQDDFYRIIQQVQAGILEGKFSDYDNPCSSANIPRMAWGKVEHDKKIIPEGVILNSVVAGATSGNSSGVWKEKKGSIEVTNEKPTSDVDEEDPEQRKARKASSVPLWIALDRLCRGLLPVTFGIFNGIYWTLLLTGSEIQDHRTTAESTA